MFKALERAERERVSDYSEKTILPDKRKYDEIVAQSILNQKIISILQPGSLAVEQFKKLRVNLRNLKIPEAAGTTLITSSKESEGKTIVATNFAVTIARELNTYALLVEADIRKPMIARWFGLPGDKGLSDYLAGDVTELSDILLRTQIEKLSIIPGGSIKENPVELIGSKKMENLILELKSRYPDRQIIIDSSPLLATTEPSVMTKWVDAVLLVIQAGKTAREEVEQAIGHVQREKIIGVVLNQLEFHMKALHSKYFGSAGYYHNYGAIEEVEKEAGRWKKITSFGKAGE
jgi:exopolysaccharide/PEP-CTERM locus tyrosine autokinase